MHPEMLAGGQRAGLCQDFMHLSLQMKHRTILYDSCAPADRGILQPCFRAIASQGGKMLIFGNVHTALGAASQVSEQTQALSYLSNACSNNI